jgi:hypothetical protein
MTMALPTNHAFTEVRVSCHSPSVGGSPIAAYATSPIRGRIIKVGGVINGAITSADCSVAVAINGVAVTGSPFTITQAGSAAGTMGTMTPTGANTVNEDDYISFTPSGASGSTITGNFWAVIAKG